MTIVVFEEVKYREWEATLKFQATSKEEALQQLGNPNPIFCSTKDGVLNIVL